MRQLEIVRNFNERGSSLTLCEEHKLAKLRLAHQPLFSEVLGRCVSFLLIKRSILVNAMAITLAYIHHILSEVRNTMTRI